MAVQVLLATYNSERFLGELLDSLAGQTHREFELVVSDDASSDRTLEIVSQRASLFDVVPRVIARDTPTGSASANFASLLQSSDADYVLLADHDDVWHPRKIETTLMQLREIEDRHGPAHPAMVHTDLRVVDAEGSQIAESYWAFRAIAPEFGTRLNTALMHATVTGCAAGMNRALVNRIGVIPPGSVMHDWWLSLVAVVFGTLEFNSEQQIDYRVHGGNVSRPEKTDVSRALRAWNDVERVQRWLRLRLEQGEAFLAAYGADLPADSREVLEDFASLRTANSVTRRWRLLRGGYRSPDLWRNVAAFALI